MAADMSEQSVLELQCTRCGALRYLTVEQAQDLATLIAARGLDEVVPRHDPCRAVMVPTRARPGPRAPWLPYAVVVAVARVLDLTGFLDDYNEQEHNHPQATTHD